MPQQELLKKVVQVLKEAGIAYMVTGSTVSSLQGEPRLTHDIDLVVNIEKPAVKKLIKAFHPPRFYLNEESILEAIAKRDMFNLVDGEEGGKVDFWILKDEPFDRARFRRKRIAHVMGIKMYVSSPEDTILAKLKWAKMSGGSEKQFTDALRVYEVQGKKLDMIYLKSWVKKLEVESLWNKLIKEARVA